MYWIKTDKHSGAVYQVLTEFKTTCDSVTRATLYNILNEYGLPVEQVRLRNPRQMSQGYQEHSLINLHCLHA